MVGEEGLPQYFNSVPMCPGLFAHAGSPRPVWLGPECARGGAKERKTRKEIFKKKQGHEDALLRLKSRFYCLKSEKRKEKFQNAQAGA